MDNQRLILFIVFSFSLLLLWEAWQDKNAPAPAAPTTATAPITVPPTPSQALNAPAAAPTQAGFAKGTRAIVETDVLRATIDGNGGDLRQLQLLAYRESDAKDQVFTLFTESQTQPYLAQSGLVGKGLPTHRSQYQLNPGTYRLAGGAAQVEVPMVWTDPATGGKTPGRSPGPVAAGHWP